jgi:hypothetical protein
VQGGGRGSVDDMVCGLESSCWGFGLRSRPGELMVFVSEIFKCVASVAGQRKSDSAQRWN